MPLDPAYVLFLLGLLQLIIAGLGAWTLATIIRLQSRITSVETLLQTSLISDVGDLKIRMSEVEKNCLKRQCHLTATS